MRYGLSFIPTGGDFKGFRIGLEVRHGIPYLWETVMDAASQIERFFGHDSNRVDFVSGVKIMPEPAIMLTMKLIVEFYSGRIRRILIPNSDGSFMTEVVNPAKPPYEDLLPMFVREYRREIAIQERALSKIDGNPRLTYAKRKFPTK